MRKNFDFFKAFAFFTLFAVAFSIFGILLPSKTNKTSRPADTNISPIIVIDAGHGGEDGGASAYGDITEKELNLLISKDVCDILRFCGIKVIMTRTDDVLLYDKNSDYQGKKKSQDLAKRLEIANSLEGAVLVSIHMNAFPEAKYKGLQVYFSPHTESSYTLASAIQNNVKATLSPDNERKVKKADKQIYLLDRFKGTGILIECGFLSNPEEYSLLCTEEYRKQLSLVIAQSITDYLANGGR